MKPRRALHVSTFPFLAVLLCAMGALILLLLVIDRRAKIVARIKARQVAERLAGSGHQARERARQALAARDLELKQQIDLVKEQQRAAMLKQAAAAAEATTLKSDVTVANQKLKAASELVAGDQKVLEQAVATSNQVLELEKTATALQRAQERPAYSVIPYRGRSGERVRPTYVECRGHEIVFQPIGTIVSDQELTPARLRTELGKQAQTAPKPYIMFLVRPDGIAMYYRATHALTDQDIEYGYELVDADWVLDFKGNQSGPSNAEIVQRFPPIQIQPKVPASTIASPFAGPYLAKQASRAIGDEPAMHRASGFSNVPGNAGGQVARGTNLPQNVVAASSQMRTLAADPARDAASTVESPVLGRTIDLGQSGTGNQAMANASAPPTPPGQRGSTTSNGAETVSGLTWRESKKPAAALTRYSVFNRDLIIRIECGGDEILIQPPSTRVAVKGMAREGWQALLADVVRQQLARRDRALATGEAPPRTELHFLVRPDGLRTYYEAYPAVESLRLPMFRENMPSTAAAAR
jgi:hypothetical protein